MENLHSILNTSRFTNYKIIVVDDDDGLTRLIQKKLKRAGFITTLANTGNQALSLVKGEANELLLLDYNLPDFSGKELVVKLRDKFGKSPGFVIMTGFGDEKVAVEMMTLGAKDYIVKETGFLDLLPDKIKNICIELEKDRELQQAQKALHETQQMYKGLYETMLEGVIYQNEKNEIISANPAALKILGLTSDEITGLTSLNPRWKAIDENHNEMPGEKHPAVRAFKTGEKIKNTVIGVFNAQKNDYVWLLVNAVPHFRNGDSTPSQVYTTFIDITERKKAEDSVRESEERLKILFEFAPDAIFLKDLNGNFVDGNMAFEKLFGYAKEHLIGKNIVDKRFIAEKYLVKAADILKANETGKGSGPDEIDLFHKDGFTVTAEVRTYPVKIGGKTFILGIAHDVTERKKAVNNLKRSEEKYRNIFENIQDVYYEINPDGIITEISPSIHHFSLGQYNREELIGTGVSSLYKNPEDRNGVLSQMQKNGFIHDYEITFLNKDGSEIICSVTARAKVNKNGETEKIVGNLHNITEQKKAKEDLIAAKEKAEESDRLKSAFLANMSHEIRTPMNGILGFTDMLKEPDLEGSERENYVNIIQNSGNRMLQTLNDLIDISKIETGQVTLDFKSVNIQKEIRSLVNFFKAEATKKGIKLVVSEECQTIDIETETDNSKFTSVLSNLINNAIKYTHQGYVKIGCKNTEGQLLFSVEDTGIGIPSNRINDIFERFVQVEAGYTRDYEGTGLGLPIAKAYAEMLGGKLWAESEAGKGSVFYFSLPVHPVQKTGTPVHSATNTIAEADNKKLTILIAEDDETSRFHLKLVLRKLAKELLIAETGEEAVDICRERTDLDVVLMDIKMPVLNGYDATRKIREFNKDITIIAQTAYAMTGDHEKAIESGCNDYIAKPINKKELLEKIIFHTEKKPEYARK